MKKYLLILLLISSNASANLYDNLGFISGEYVGTCYALQHLQKKYCQTIPRYFPSLCINAVINFVPDNIKNILQKEFDNNQELMLKNSVIGADIGMEKALSMSDRNIERSCAVYSTMLITKNHQLYEELKRMRGLFK